MATRVLIGKRTITRAPAGRGSEFPERLPVAWLGVGAGELDTADGDLQLDERVRVSNAQVGWRGGGHLGGPVDGLDGRLGQRSDVGPGIVLGQPFEGRLCRACVAGDAPQPADCRQLEIEIRGLEGLDQDRDDRLEGLLEVRLGIDRGRLCGQHAAGRPCGPRTAVRAASDRARSAVTIAARRTGTSLRIPTISRRMSASACSRPLR